MPVRRRRAGFTLVEMLVSGVGVVVVFASMFLMSHRATEAMDEKARSEHLITRLHRAVDRIIEPLAEAEGDAVLAIAGGSDTLTYQLPTG